MKQNLGATGKCAEFLVGRLSRSLLHPSAASSIHFSFQTMSRAYIIHTLALECVKTHEAELNKSGRGQATKEASNQIDAERAPATLR